jgi:hypothetical protein
MYCLQDDDLTCQERQDDLVLHLLCHRRSIGIGMAVAYVKLGCFSRPEFGTLNP